VDNDSGDDSIQFVQQRWRDVAIIRMPNRCLVSFNEAVERVDEPIVLLLNNDVKLKAGCVDHLADTIERRPDCFLASPLCFGFDGRYEGTLSELCFRRGLVHTRLVQPSEATLAEGPRFTASAGAVFAVDRAKFLALGGFDSLYLPGRYEDLDLAYRGWLAGWTACFVPDAVAWHLGRATFGPQYGDSSDELDVRNSLLFAWKHLRSSAHWASHLTYLAARVLGSLVHGRTPFLRGLAGAIGRLPQVAHGRGQTTERARCEHELFRSLRAESLSCC
jgi:GT2 family glycosyltransferase